MSFFSPGTWSGSPRRLQDTRVGGQRSSEGNPGIEPHRFERSPPVAGALFLWQTSYWQTAKFVVLVRCTQMSTFADFHAKRQIYRDIDTWIRRCGSACAYEFRSPERQRVLSWGAPGCSRVAEGDCVRIPACQIRSAWRASLPRVQGAAGSKRTGDARANENAP